MCYSSWHGLLFSVNLVIKRSKNQENVHDYHYFALRIFSPLWYSLQSLSLVQITKQ